MSELCDLLCRFSLEISWRSWFDCIRRTLDRKHCTNSYQWEWYCEWEKLFDGVRDLIVKTIELFEIGDNCWLNSECCDCESINSGNCMINNWEF
jgi:hypothetical protein